MSYAVIAFLTFAVFATSLISGTFGMAGGMILMAVMLTLLPVATAVTLQSSIQLVSNSWRCFLWRAHIVWHVLPWYLSGILAGFILMLCFRFVPDKNLAFIIIGVVPLLSMAAGKYCKLHIENPYHSFFAATVLTFVHMTAGVIGPLLDLLYINTALTRQQIIATKAFTQTIMHLMRLGYYGALIPLLTGAGGWPEELSALWLPLLLGASVAGTSAAAFVVRRMDDQKFKLWSRYLIVIISVYCIFKGVCGFFAV
jgi:uncharacterized membrane protein YfcA